MTVDTSRNYETLVGRDGWLFMTKIDGLFEKHRGEITLSELINKIDEVQKRYDNRRVRNHPE